MSRKYLTHFAEFVVLNLSKDNHRHSVIACDGIC